MIKALKNKYVLSYLKYVEERGVTAYHISSFIDCKRII